MTAINLATFHHKTYNLSRQLAEYMATGTEKLPGGVHRACGRANLGETCMLFSSISTDEIFEKAVLIQNGILTFCFDSITWK